MGFSFHITTIYAGAELPMHYKNHLECVYCISGEGSIEDLATGQVHEAVLPREALARATRAWLVNGVRGWVPLDVRR